MDESPVDVKPVQTIHPVQTEPTPQTKIARKPPLSEGIVTDNEVNECYNMSIKEFERSGIHGLFKVSFIRLSVFSISFQNNV